MKADILGMETTTGSDHDLPLVEILLVKGNSTDTTSKTQQTLLLQIVWKLNKATKENWATIGWHYGISLEKSCYFGF